MLCYTTIRALLGYVLGKMRSLAPTWMMGETGKSAKKVGYKMTRGEDNTQVTMAIAMQHTLHLH